MDGAAPMETADGASRSAALRTLRPPRLRPPFPQGLGNRCPAALRSAIPHTAPAIPHTYSMRQLRWALWDPVLGAAVGRAPTANTKSPPSPPPGLCLIRQVRTGTAVVTLCVLPAGARRQRGRIAAERPPRMPSAERLGVRGRNVPRAYQLPDIRQLHGPAKRPPPSYPARAGGRKDGRPQQHP